MAMDYILKLEMEFESEEAAYVFYNELLIPMWVKKFLTVMVMVMVMVIEEMLVKINFGWRN